MADSIILKTKSFTVINRKSKNENWHFIDRKPGVAVLAITNDNHVVLVKQKRPVVNKTLLEIPAGGIDLKQTLINQAKRELEEETGFRSKNFTKLLELYPSPGYYNEKTTIFLATKLYKGKQHLTTSELKNSLKVLLMPFKKVLANIKSGKIQDAKTVVAVLFYKKNKGSE